MGTDFQQGRNQNSDNMWLCGCHDDTLPVSGFYLGEGNQRVCFPTRFMNEYSNTILVCGLVHPPPQKNNFF